MKTNLGWLGAMLVPLCATAAAPPVGNLLSASPVAPTVLTNYPVARTEGAIAWGTLSPDLKALARTLGSDHLAEQRITQAEYAQNVYDYVHNNIDTEFRFGLSKGGRGALIDQSGTPFDQAELMVKLLRFAGVTAEYKVGTITLSEQQFGRWTGLVRNVVEASQAVDVDARSACQFLADGGIPTTIAGDCTTLTNDITNISLTHIWVTAAGKSFDPSFKQYTIHRGLTDLTTRLGCGSACGANAVSAALTDADTSSRYGFPSIKSVNEGELNEFLRDRGTDLANYLKANRRLASVPEIVSGKRLLDPVSVTAPVTLSYASTPTLSWGGGIPDSFRTKLRIRFAGGESAGADRTFFADELAGRRLQLADALSPEPSGFLIDGTDGAPYQVLTTPNNCTSCLPGWVLLNVDHPYAAGNGLYADEQRELAISGFSSNGTRSTFPITIVHGFGAGSAATERHYSSLQETQADEEDYASWIGSNGLGQYEIYRSADHTIPTAKLRKQGAAADRIITGLARSQITRHHDIGVVYSDVSSPGSAFSMSIVSAVSVVPDVSNADGLTRRNLAFSATTATWAMLEGSVNQEIDRSDVGLSTAYLFHFGNSLAPADRWAFIDVSQSQMQSSPFTGIANFTTPYKDRLHEAGAEGFAGILTDRMNGGEFFTKPGSIGHTIRTYLKGGAGLSVDPIGKAVESAKVVDVAAERKKYLSVSPADGSMTLTQTDLVTGEGAFPASLSLQRIYKSDVPVSEEIIEGWSNSDTDQDSQQYPRSYRYSGPDSAATSRIGGGWTHNYNVILTLSGNGGKGLGSDSAVEGSGAIAALWTLMDLQRSGDFSSRLTTVFTSYWLGTQLAFNSANLDNGGASESFQKLPDGSFFNMRGDSRLVQNDVPGAGNNFLPVTFEYTGKDGDKISFDWMKSRRYPRYPESAPALVDPVFKAKTWTFPDGQVVTFAYTGRFLVNSWQGNPQPVRCTLAPSCTGDAVNMSLPYGFVLDSVSNNRGRSLTFGTESVSVQMSGQSMNVLDSHTSNFRITHVTADDGREVRYLPSECPSIGATGISVQQPARLTCAKLTVRAPDNSETVFSYAPGTDSPDPAVLQRPDYRLRRWYTPGAPPPAAPFRVARYDELFRVLSITDALDRSTFYYPGGVMGTERWKRSEVVSPMGAVSRSEFDDRNSALRVRDPLGHETVKTYDNAGRVVRTRFPEGNAETVAYDVRSNVTQTCRLAKGRGDQTCSISDGDLSSDTTFVEGAAVAICVNPASCNKPYIETNPRRYVTRNTWNNSTGLLERVERGLNTSLACALASGGCPQIDAVYTSPNGTQIKFLTSVTKKISASSNLVTTFTYNPDNHWVPWTGTVDSGSGLLNLTTTLTYDQTGNLTQVDGPRTDVSDLRNFIWDDQRRLTNIIEPDPDGAGTLPRLALRTVYDIEGLVSSSIRGTTTNAQASDFVAHETTAFRYDAVGNQRRMTSPAGVTQTSYDDDDRILCSAVRMNPDVYESLTDDACALSAVGAMGADRITKKIYDDAGQVLKEQRAFGTPLQQDYFTAKYTPNGKQDWVEDANGNRSELVYDGFDRLCRQYYPQTGVGAHLANTGQPVNTVLACGSPNTGDYEFYDYDANDNRSTFRRRGTGTASARTISYTYDSLDRETRENLPGSDTFDVHTRYDLLDRKLFRHFGSSAGSVSSNCTATAAGIDYCYDRVGRLTRENAYGRPLDFQYNQAGNRNRMSWPGGGLFVRYTQDAAERMKLVCENSEDCSSGVLATYNYDSRGRRGSVTRQNGVTTQFDYDGASRLTSVAHDMGGGATQDITFGMPDYNPASQVRRRTVSNALYDFSPPLANRSYTPDGLNRYANVGGTTYTYDVRGNLTSDGSRTFTYDILNRLTAVSGSAAMTLAYDPAGRLYQTTVGSTTTTFLYDNDKLTAEYNGASSSATLLRRYVHGAGIDEPLVWYEMGSPVTKRWLHADHQGSIIATTNSSGAATVYAYGPYGEPQNDVWTGSRFRYTGQIVLNDAPGLRLYHYKARVYDPALGRFLQTDRIGTKDDFNLYSYVYNDPFNKVDPDGEFFLQAAAMLGGAIANVVAQAVVDVAKGEFSGGAAYAGAAAGGAVQGLVLSTTGCMQCAGAAGGAVSSAVSQKIAKGSVDGTQVAVAAGIGAATGGIPGARIPGATAGRNSWQAVARSTNTKLGNGTISLAGVAPTTMAKAGGAATVEALPGALVSTAATEGANAGIDAAANVVDNVKSGVREVVNSAGRSLKPKAPSCFGRGPCAQN